MGIAMNESRRTVLAVLTGSLFVVCAVILAGVAAIGQQDKASAEENSMSTVKAIAETMPGTDWRVTVSEGPREPASIGSYALRLYVPFDPEWPFDNYVDGEVRVRDGSLTKLLFSDLNDDKTMDAIVVAQSAGSGGYLQVDGFLLNKEGITFAHSVDGLASDADPVASLKADMEKSEE